MATFVCRWNGDGVRHLLGFGDDEPPVTAEDARSLQAALEAAWDADDSEQSPADSASESAGDG